MSQNPLSDKPTKKDLQRQLKEITKALQSAQTEALEHQKQKNQQAQRLVRLLQETEKQQQRFQNVEKPRLVEAAQIEIIVQLLPVLDSLERAFKSVPAELKENDWAKGMPLIESQLKVYLNNLSLTPIVTIGQKFDPHTMEAVETIASRDKESDLVLEEVLKGYFFKDKVIRHAQVKVVQNN